MLHDHVRTFIRLLQDEAWDDVPVLILACAGGSDEHLQVWHPCARLDLDEAETADAAMPAYTIVATVDGPRIEVHPDADPDYIEYVWDGAGALRLRTEDD